MKTVFFGPFFGEVGWEVSFWHGWVRKMCREKYQLYRKIAASYPGREPFYPDVDEFWPHPPEVTKLRISQRGYIADCWINNLPEADNDTDVDKNVSQYAESLLNEYKNKLPQDTIFYVPHKLNVYQLGNKKRLFGTLFVKGISLYKRPKVLSLDFEEQIFEELKPTPEGERFLNSNFNTEKRIIAIFPRHRSSRRPDKDWPREKYDLLIKRLQKKYPRHVIGIFGAPGGTYYTEGVPSNCFDFINLPEEMRFNVQLAALKQSDLVVGSTSGMLLGALLAKCPMVQWGWGVHKRITEEQNFLKTRLAYWSEMNPSVEVIEKLVDLVINKREKEIVYPSFPKESWNIKEKESFIIRKINFGRIVLREIVARTFLKYLKTRKLKEGIINNFILIQ